jgi:hypothetical protein
MHIYPYIHTYLYTCINTYFKGISVQKGTRYFAIDFAIGVSKEGVAGVGTTAGSTAVAGDRSTGPLGGGFTRVIGGLRVGFTGVTGGLRVGFTGVTGAKPTSPATVSDN